MTWVERLRGVEVHRDPFPHLIIDDGPPEDLLETAIRTFPDLGLICELASRSVDLETNARASLEPQLDDKY